MIPNSIYRTPKDVQIRPMTEEDISSALHVIASAWNKASAQHAEPDLRDMFNTAAWRPMFNVIEADGKIIAVASYQVSPVNYGIYCLSWVGVAKAYQRCGYGKAIVRHCLTYLRAMSDYVMLTTEQPEFYRKHFGFSEIAQLPLADSPNSVLMIKNMNTDTPVVLATPPSNDTEKRRS